MQPNEIILAVDTLNDSNTTDLTLSRFEESLNRTIYTSGSHSINSRDQLALYRTMPSQSGNFKGVAKSTIKFTKDFSVLGVDGLATLTSPVILSCSLSAPVGVTSAQLVEMRQRAVALLDSDTIMTALNFQLQI
jgi:hypothetical protein